MAYKFNPFTDTLDIVGSGGGSYIDGVVADSSLLPVTLGTPALDAVYLAKAGSGVWLISRKPAGLYVRVANNGVAADWTYLGAFPEVNADGNWELYNTADPTKELKFDLSGITTASTVTLTAPASSGTLALTSDFAAPPAIGNTTPAAGNFTNVTLKDSTGGEVATFDAQAKLTDDRTYDLPDASGTLALTTLLGTPIEYVIACSDETSDLTTGTAKVTFRAPVAFKLTGVAASVNTAPTDADIEVDINNGANSALSTLLTIDDGEKTSATATTAAVIDTDYDDIAADAEITIDIDQIGSTIAGKGLKVVLKGVRA
jgi:hypothetical protein